MAGKKGGTSVASATEEKRETGIRARIDRVFDDEKGKLKAVASANIGDFAVHGIRLYQDDKGEFFISMPSNSYKNAKGETQYDDIFHPVTKEARNALSDAVMDAYEQKLAEAQTASQSSSSRNLSWLWSIPKRLWAVRISSFQQRLLFFSEHGVVSVPIL